ncbi:MAG: DUF3141 domain-containing protein, partial [Pseudomonadota bacterium]
SRTLLLARNPWVAPLEGVAGHIRATCRPAGPQNPFLAAKALWVQSGEQSIDLWRDCRDMACDLAFHTKWCTLSARVFGHTPETCRSLQSHDEVRVLLEVALARATLDPGGFAEAVVRMLVVLADNRGDVWRHRIERAARVLTGDAPFASRGAARGSSICARSLQPSSQRLASPHRRASCRMRPSARFRSLATVADA